MTAEPRPGRQVLHRSTWTVARLRTPWLLTRELALVLGLFFAYDAGRLLGGKSTTKPFTNAYDVLDVERWLHLPHEQTVQSWFLDWLPAIKAANDYYAAVHLPLTGAVILWLFFRRKDHYRRFRNSLFAATFIALAVYLLIPVAPPRKLSGQGFVDTGLLLGQSVYDSKGGKVIANQYAAMPSMHVGWALLVAMALIASSKTRWRWLWVLHPTITFLVVVATGNHYWLDGIAGVALVVATYHFFGRFEPAKPEVLRSRAALHARPRPAVLAGPVLSAQAMRSRPTGARPTTPKRGRPRP